MTGASTKVRGRTLAYRLGQLLAIGEVAAKREHDPALMRLATLMPDKMIATLQPHVLRSGAWQERRWANVMGVMPDIPTEALSEWEQTQLGLGYWHERALFHRAGRMIAMRKAAGMTQTDWAQALGVSMQTVQSWEGHRNNVPEKYEKLAKMVKQRHIN